MDSSLRLLTIHAHPDDECIVTGGVLADAIEKGHQAKVLTCTDGRRGEIVDPSMDPVALAPILHEIRAKEMADAMAILGGVAFEFLGYHDSGMFGDEGNEDPQSFWRANLDDAISKTVNVIRAYRPHVTIVYDPYGGYGHPDHIQAHRVGMLAVEAAAVGALYPDLGDPWDTPKTYQAAFTKDCIAWVTKELLNRGLGSPWGDATDPKDILVGVPENVVTTRVDVRPQLAKKLDALRAHKSQVAETSHFFNLPSDLEQTFYGYEDFRLVRANIPITPKETDIFAGL